MSRTDGGQAFPSSTVTRHGGALGVDIRTDIPGMSLRDYFAARALQGMFSSEGTGPNERSWGDVKAMAEHAYEAADAMLRVRARA